MYKTTGGATEENAKILPRTARIRYLWRISTIFVAIYLCVNMNGKTLVYAQRHCEDDYYGVMSDQSSGIWIGLSIGAEMVQATAILSASFTRSEKR